MWIASKYGWFSVVQKEPSIWHIRARVRADLETLKAEADLSGEVQSWPDADYRYRIVTEDPADIARVFEAFATSIDYSNFKSKIGATPDQRAKLHAYHNIWAEMYSLQD